MATIYFQNYFHIIGSNGVQTNQFYMVSTLKCFIAELLLDNKLLYRVFYTQVLRLPLYFLEMA